MSQGSKTSGATPPAPALPRSFTASAAKAWSQEILLPGGISIRLASHTDLPSLLELESHWPHTFLASSEATLRQRLEAHPTGQLVAVASDGRLLGAVYTQRVPSYASLRSTCHARERELHQPDGPVLQLLSVVQLPGAKVGDQLRRYVLHLGRLDATIERACSVARCCSYAPSTSGTTQAAHQAHVDAGSDAGLLFHSLAGASIGELVAGYRPEDVQNLGYGVMITYEFRATWAGGGSADAGAITSAVTGSAVAQLPTSMAECEAIIIEAISSLSYGSRDASEASWSAARKRMGFMDLGVDSLDAVKFVQGLNERLSLSLGGTVIFEQPNVRELAAYIHAELQGMPARDPAPTFSSHRIKPHRNLGIAGTQARWPGSTGVDVAVLRG